MTSNSSFFRPDTFWTLCNRCHVQYEYTNIFLNQTLLCYRCHQPFLAIAIPDRPVHSHSSRSRPFPNQQQQDMHAATQLSASRTSQASSSHTSKKQAKRRHEMPLNMERENGPSSVNGRTRELSQRNIRAMLIGKAKTEIRHRLNQWEKEKEK